MSPTAAAPPEPPDVDHHDYDDSDTHAAGETIVRRNPDEADTSARQSLADLLGRLGWEGRDAQSVMAGAVARSLAAKQHLLVEAPTGTGKSLAYLVPAAEQARATGAPVVVVTATKALQQQVLDADSPLLARLWPDLEIRLMKGRGNYACLSRVQAIADGTEETLFDEVVDPHVWGELLSWTDTTDTGDRADAPDGVTNAMWSKVSVGPKECVGAKNCQFAQQCFAEKAGIAARDADIVVTNSHLYLLDAAIGGSDETDDSDGKDSLPWSPILPPHRDVIVDEAHKLAETASRVFGVEIRHGRGKTIKGVCKGLVKDEQLDGVVAADDRLLAELLSFTETGPVDPSVGNLNIALDDYLLAVRSVAKKVSGIVVAVTQPKDAEKKKRALNVLGGAIEDLAAVLRAGEDEDNDDVVWVEGDGRRKPVLKMAPVDVGPLLDRYVFSRRTVAMCSATMTVGGDFNAAAEELGLTAGTWDSVSVPSPFDHANNGLLYIPMGRNKPLTRADGTVLPAVEALVPGPNATDFRDRANDLTLRMIEAAEGRALLLFTSWKALNDTTEWLRDRVPYTVLAQGDKPTGRLLAEFMADEQSVLCMTATGWEGISAPGPSCSLVVIDRIPFPRRDDPLINAQRELATKNRRSDFHSVDVPKAARMLAQGVGRLIRTVSDTGVVAVLDTRLGTKRSYNGTLLGSLPPFKRSIHLDEEVLPFLRAIAEDRRDKVPPIGTPTAVETVDDDDAFDGIDEAA
ncbi:ATP-dependent DNA helicase [Euzebya pacifica]|nr:ATP-dependent DNA helicase [Euzebya pacifica]